MKGPPDDEPQDEAPVLPDADLQGPVSELAEAAEALANTVFPDGEIPEVFQPEDDPEAPPLPLSQDEPPAAPRLRVSEDVQPLQTLQKITASARQGAARAALRNALEGEPYDARDLPNSAALVQGMRTVLEAHGLSTEALVEAVFPALGKE